MSAEIPRQYDFSGELVDTRTRKQKRIARQSGAWQQAEMFSQRDVAQFGVATRPEMPAVTPNGQPPRMVLQVQDPRTGEQKAADLQRQAEALNASLWPGEDAPNDDT